MRDSLVPLLDRHLSEFEASFIWGVRDCVLFTGGWIYRATGRNLVPESISWNDRRSAYDAMREIRCTDARALASRFLEEAPLLTARIGDIVGRDMPHFGFVLGICTGADGAFLGERNGTVRYRVSACHACWRVD